MEPRQQIAISAFVSDRTPRPLMGPILSFDLPAEIASLHAEQVWRDHGHNARTLIKHSEFRLVLISLQAGKHVHARETDEPLALQMLSGSARVHVPTEVVELKAGQLLSLDRNIPYEIETVDTCELLLWLGWSKDAPQPRTG